MVLRRDKINARAYFSSYKRFKFAALDEERRRQSEIGSSNARLNFL